MRTVKMIEDNKWSTFMHPQILRKLIYEKITKIANFVTTESHHLLQSETVISFSISAGLGASDYGEDGVIRCDGRKH